MGGRDRRDTGVASTVERDVEVIVFQDAGGTLIEIQAVELERGDDRLEPDTSSAVEEPLTWPPGDPRWLLDSSDA
jgi:hypothetical protein